MAGFLGVGKTAERAETYSALGRAIDAGLPLSGALRLVAPRAGQLGQVFEQVAADLDRGQSVAKALQGAQQQREIPQDEALLLEAGEESGTLPQMLERQAARLEKKASRRRRMLFSLAYPWLLLNAAILAVGAPLVVQGVGPFMAFVIPKLALLWGVTLGTAVLVSRVAATEPGRRRLTDLAAVVPMAGTAVRLRAASDYGFAMSMALGAGLALSRSLRLATEATGWTPLREAGERVAGRVAAGADLGAAHGAEPAIPRELADAVRLGEAGGTLETSVAAAAAVLEERGDQRANQVAVVVPVVVYLLVALVVALVVIRGFLGVMALPDI